MDFILTASVISKLIFDTYFTLKPIKRSIFMMFDNQNISDALEFNRYINKTTSKLSEPLLITFGINIFTHIKLFDNKILHISKIQGLL